MFVTIKKRDDFLYAFKSGNSFASRLIILQMVKRKEEHRAPAEEIRIGFTATKKMGNAVVRNRIRRRLRVAVQPVLEKYGVAGHDYVIVARSGIDTCKFPDLIENMEFAFSRIIKHKGNAFQNGSKRNSERARTKKRNKKQVS